LANPPRPLMASLTLSKWFGRTLPPLAEGSTWVAVRSWAHSHRESLARKPRDLFRPDCRDLRRERQKVGGRAIRVVCQQTIRQKTADAVDAARGPSFAADQDEGSQRGPRRPIPPLVPKIQVTTTNEGARAQGGLTPDFLALSQIATVREARAPSVPL
jgi:hypothetical protein